MLLKGNVAKKLNIKKIRKLNYEIFTLPGSLNIAEDKEIHSTKNPFSRIISYLTVSSRS